MKTGKSHYRFLCMLLLAAMSLSLVAAGRKTSWNGNAPKQEKQRIESSRILTGYVFKVADGDTLTLRMASGETVKVRLFGIDSPERNQEMGGTAGEFLASLTLHKNIRVQSKGKDRYGRTLGIVFLGEMNVNLEMIRQGLAWHYSSFAADETKFSKAQLEAQKAGRGIWSSGAVPVPPWEYRKKKISQK